MNCATAISGTAPTRCTTQTRRSTWWWWAAASAGSRRPISTAKHGRARKSSSSTITTISAATPSATNSMSSGHTLLMNGGTLEIDSPYPYSAVADGLLKTLGVDPRGAGEGMQRPFHLCRPQTARVLRPPDVRRRQAGGGRAEGRGRMEGFPDAKPAQRKDARLESCASRPRPTIPCPGLTSDAKKDRLSRLSYQDYLLTLLKADPSVVPYYQHQTDDLWGCGIDAVSALDCWGVGLSGFPGLEARARVHRADGLYAGRLCPNRRLLQLSFSGRQRLHRAAAGARPDPRRAGWS